LESENADEEDDDEEEEEAAAGTHFLEVAILPPDLPLKPESDRSSRFLSVSL
jgi:hypothetical protein